MDFIPNHTSDEHWWFEQSRKATKEASNPYKDYYVWHDGRKGKNGTRMPPNNWVSITSAARWLDLAAVLMVDLTSIFVANYPPRYDY